MTTPTIKPGDYVRLIKQTESHLTGKRPVKLGTEGRVLATRANGTELLIKFDGHASPRHTDAKDVKIS